ncbi:MAG: hypothetical protein WCV99_14045 [Sterolibacterium sp.]|jgi:hypothetical protein
MSFATLEARINAVAVAKLANATATIAGEVVAGTFDADYQEILGASAVVPAFASEAAALATVARGAALTIDCTSLGLADAPYTVAEVQAEHGITRLLLRRVVG